MKMHLVLKVREDIASSRVKTG